METEAVNLAVVKRTLKSAIEELKRMRQNVLQKVEKEIEKGEWDGRQRRREHYKRPREKKIHTRNDGWNCAIERTVMEDVGGGGVNGTGGVLQPNIE